MKRPLFITGIGTGIGKSIVSAIITQKLNADYWKPIQSGDLDKSDTNTIKALLSNSNSICFEEQFKLTQPLSPHLSAKIDNININIKDFILPKTNNQLIIEGAGGVMVPINDNTLIIDLIPYFNADVIIVANSYLGSINHTLMTINVLKYNNIPIKGIIFNGESNYESEKYILNYSKINLIGKIPFLKYINKETIINAGEDLVI